MAFQNFPHQSSRTRAYALSVWMYSFKRMIHTLFCINDDYDRNGVDDDDDVAAATAAAAVAIVAVVAMCAITIFLSRLHWKISRSITYFGAFNSYLNFVLLHAT